MGALYQCQCDDPMRNTNPHRDSRVPFCVHGLALIPAWISNYIHNKVWDKNTYLFPNFNGVAVEVWEWISNSTHTLLGIWFIHPCWDSSQPVLVKGAKGVDIADIFLNRRLYFVVYPGLSWFGISRLYRHSSFTDISIWDMNKWLHP